jgi:hypothetical protein
VKWPVWRRFSGQRGPIWYMKRRKMSERGGEMGRHVGMRQWRDRGAIESGSKKYKFQGGVVSDLCGFGDDFFGSESGPIGDRKMSKSERVWFFLVPHQKKEMPRSAMTSSSAKKSQTNKQTNTRQSNPQIKNLPFYPSKSTIFTHQNIGIIPIKTPDHLRAPARPPP